MGIYIGYAQGFNIEHMLGFLKPIQHVLEQDKPIGVWFRTTSVVLSFNGLKWTA